MTIQSEFDASSLDTKKSQSFESYQKILSNWTQDDTHTDAAQTTELDLPSKLSKGKIVRSKRSTVPKGK